MSRTRRSAKAAGAKFEKDVADYLEGERRRLAGSKDTGDIAGVPLGGRQLVIECKNTAQMKLAQWWSEADAERGNVKDTEPVHAVVAHKRHGKGAPEDQWVTLTLGELRDILDYVHQLSETVKGQQQVINELKKGL